MGIFNINYANLVSTLLPVRLRKPIQTAWLKALVSGSMLPLYNTFSSNRSNNLYFLSHCSQVCFLEATLNDNFDNTSRRIFISDMYIANQLYVYLDIESYFDFIGLDSEIGSTSYSSPSWLYTGAEMSAATNGFIVNIPIIYSGVISSFRIRSLVDKYRLPGYGSYFILYF